MSIQEAVDLEKSPQLRRLFSPHIFGRLPSTGRSRIRRTALGIIGLSCLLNLYCLHQTNTTQVPTHRGFQSIPRPWVFQMKQIYFSLSFLTLFVHWLILDCASRQRRR